MIQAIGERNLRLLLIMPDANIHRLQVGSVRMSLREAPLTLTLLAALVPPELGASIDIIDESIQPVEYNASYDLVGISCLSGTAYRAYEIADRFSSLGTTVVLGGVHVGLRPSEARRHADSIVIGYAEKTWPQLLRDYRAGTLQKEYKSDTVSLDGLPHPRRDLQRKFGYIAPNTVFATRGCNRLCDFCTIAATHFGWSSRPVADVVDEIRAIKAKRIVFNDVSIVENRAYAKELFTAMRPLKKKWGGLATIDVVNDDELIELMRSSGCVYLLIGMESIGAASLSHMNKNFNNTIDYGKAIAKLHSCGIIVQGCFIFGLDDDHKDIFARTVQAVNDLKIDIPRYAIYTPYPETEAFVRLKGEGRILHEYWPHYDTQHVVFKPAQMSPEELDAGFRSAYQKTFSLSSIISRTLGSRRFPITFMGNVAYRLYLKRLLNDTIRHHHPEESESMLCHI